MQSRARIIERIDVALGRSALFGRGVVTTLAVISIGLGFLAGVRANSAHYDPHAYAMGAGALFAGACTVIAFLVYRRRRLRAQLREFENQLETLSDRNWELKESEERARSFLENQGDLIVRRDGTGRISYANDAFCALMGIARNELIGTTLAPSVIEQGDPALLSDGTRVHDQKIANRDGARWVAWREVAVRTDNGTEVQSVGRDVTDRVMAERALAEARDQAEAANRAKSRFLAMVSHEIRTPLNGILGMTDLLFDTTLTPEQKTYAKAVKTSGETLLSLIEEILDFSKIEAGKLSLDARPFLLSALVEEAVELLAPRAQSKGIEIASYIDDHLPEWVVGDAARLRQVLLNLAGNAVKFTEQGGVAVIAEPGIWPEEVRFLVRDTGIGLSADEQLRVFEEFEQGDNGASRKYAGTGLGLAISKRIVEHMDGRIGVSSVPGEGATFEVALALPPAEKNPEREFVPPDLHPMAVLIVAAATIEAELLALRLSRWGAHACVASNEGLAAALLPERQWDAVLVDCALAGKVAEILNRTGDTKQARRIVLIAPADRGELPALKQIGFDGYLVKPVRTVSLAARLRPADAIEQAAEKAVENETVTEPRPDTKSLAILVAEDNEINALLARSLLKKLGHRPTVATDGRSAFECWQGAQAAGAPYDLIFMDAQMPGVDGLEASRRIRAAESDAGNARVPIVALTANAFSEDREACIAAGMDAFLVKPLDRERLADTLAGIAIRKQATLAA